MPPDHGAMSPQPYGAPSGGQASGYGQPHHGQPAQSPAQYGPAATSPYGPAAGSPYGGSPAPYQPWGAPADKRPTGTTVGAVLAIVGGAFLLLFGVIFLALSGSGVAREQGLGREELIGLGVVSMLFAVPVLVFAILALRRIGWAAWVLLALGALYGAVTVIEIFSGGASTPLFSVAYIGVSVGLLLNPASRAWYRSRNR